MSHLEETIADLRKLYTMKKLRSSFQHTRVLPRLWSRGLPWHDALLHGFMNCLGPGADRSRSECIQSCLGFIFTAQSQKALDGVEQMRFLRYSERISTEIGLLNHVPRHGKAQRRFLTCTNGRQAQRRNFFPGASSG